MSMFDIECALKGKRKGGHLENWYITIGVDSYGDSVSQGHGNVYNDSRFTNGTFIHTSLVVNHHVDENILETNNTYYTLGVPRVIDKESDKSKLTDEQLEALLRSMI